MADAFLDLTHLLVINDNNLADIEVSDLLQDAPVLAALAADVASNGTLHKYTKEIGAPVVGFRAANTGVFNTVSADQLVTVTLKILDASCVVDKALALAYKKGSAAYIAREVQRHLKAAFFMAEKQIINGAGNDAAGFVGLADNAGYDKADDTMVLNAGGTTPATGSSVWAIRTNSDGSDAQVIAGEDGKITVGETVEQAIETATGRYTGMYTSVLGWLGLQIGGAYSVGRICNLTAQDGKGLTDDVIANMLAKFPAGRLPTFLAMNRRSRTQLQQSRTAVNATGAPAPFPVDAFGITLITTDAILSTETILTNA